MDHQIAFGAMKRSACLRLTQLPIRANQRRQNSFFHKGTVYTDKRPSIARLASTAATAPSISASSSSPWPWTVAFSLLAFVAGLSIEGRWSRKADVPVSSKAKTTSQSNESKSKASESSQRDASKDEDKPTDGETKDVSAGASPGDKGEADDKAAGTTDTTDEQVDEEAITKPELAEDDAKAWRDFAEMVHEKYGEKLGSLRELEAKHQELTEDRDDARQRLEWAKMDSQRNAELFFENMARKDVYKGMIKDDEILKACPLKPPDGLFEEGVKPTVIRILDDKDMTRSVIINLEGEAPSGDEEHADKQWDYVYDWVSDLTKLMQQSGQISDESFWNILFSKGWYKCGFPAYSFPSRDQTFPTDEVKAMIARLKSTSDRGMERYHVLTDKSHLRPFSDRLGNCSTTATVYPGDLNDEGKPRKVQVLVDTGAEITVIAAHNVPKDVKILNTYPIMVSGFGGGSASLNKRVQLRMKLHGDDEDKGIDIVTTAYVMDKTASGLGVELGTDVMKPLGPTIDIEKSVMRIDKAGKSFEAPLIYLKEDDKFREPTPQIGDTAASEEAPPSGKLRPDEIEQSEKEVESQQRLT